MARPRVAGRGPARALLSAAIALALAFATSASRGAEATNTTNTTSTPIEGAALLFPAAVVAAAAASAAAELEAAAATALLGNAPPPPPAAPKLNFSSSSSSSITSSNTTSRNSNTTTAAATAAAPAAPRPPTAAVPLAPPHPAAATPPPSDPQLRAALALHNRLRARHSAEPLEWDQALAAQARAAAQRCPEGRSFAGGGGGEASAAAPPPGENVAWGPPSLPRAVRAWYDESAALEDLMEANSTDLAIATAAPNFAQVVWKGARRVGCASSSSSLPPPSSSSSSPPCPIKTHVCLYSPAPQGSVSSNVLPLVPDAEPLPPPPATTAAASWPHAGEPLSTTVAAAAEAAAARAGGPPDDHANNSTTSTTTSNPLLQPLAASSAPATHQALARHNAYRAAHGVPPLAWDPSLERRARRWAARCPSTHDPASSSLVGESLAWGFPTPSDAVDAWYSEGRKHYHGGDGGGKGGFSPATGHFSQLLWRNTTRVGCARNARCPWPPLLVCQYWPPGNSVDADDWDAMVPPPLVSGSGESMIVALPKTSAVLEAAEEDDGGLEPPPPVPPPAPPTPPDGNENENNNGTIPDPPPLPPTPPFDNGGGSNPLPAEVRDALDLLNALRRDHRASAEHEARWDARLARSAAAALAAACANGGGGNGSNPNLNNKPGQILLLGRGAASLSAAVREWYSEGKGYDYSKPGPQRGTERFAQLVWLAATGVGCAARRGGAGGGGGASDCPALLAGESANSYGNSSSSSSSLSAYACHFRAAPGGTREQWAAQLLPPADSAPIKTKDASGVNSTLEDAQLAAALDRANLYRARHGASPLRWDARLAAGAQRAAAACPPRAGGNSGAAALAPSFAPPAGIGQTTAWGASSFAAAVDAWYDQGLSYYGGGDDEDEEAASTVGASSSSSPFLGFSPDAAAFSQLIWLSSSRVGCALATSCREVTYVCRYAAPGNVIGQGDWAREVRPDASGLAPLLQRARAAAAAALAAGEAPYYWRPGGGLKPSIAVAAAAADVSPEELDAAARPGGLAADEVAGKVQAAVAVASPPSPPLPPSQDPQLFAPRSGFIVSGPGSALQAGGGPAYVGQRQFALPTPGALNARSRLGVGGASGGASGAPGGGTEDPRFPVRNNEYDDLDGDGVPETPRGTSSIARPSPSPSPAPPPPPPEEKGEEGAPPPPPSEEEEGGEGGGDNTAAPPPPATNKPSSTNDDDDPLCPSTSSSPSDPDLAAGLALANRLRAAHGVAPLRWSTALAAAAAERAATCPRSRKRKTSDENDGPGETLAWDSPTLASAVRAWYGESEAYDFGGEGEGEGEGGAALPSPQRQRRASQFAQLVWRATSEVGCALVAECEVATYACLFSPASGQQDEDWALQVLPPLAAGGAGGVGSGGGEEEEPTPGPRPPTPPPSRPPPPPPPSNSPPAEEEQDDNSRTTTTTTTSSSPQDLALSRHNAYRARHGSPPLKWDPSLEASAAAFVAGCPTGHSGERGKGENMAWGYRTWDQAVAAWYREVEAYDFDKPGFNGGTGHFTQLVWRDSRLVGCASNASCEGGQMPAWVCQYSPPGNIMGVDWGRQVMPEGTKVPQAQGAALVLLEGA